jgi:predicted methyltransferase
MSRLSRPRLLALGLLLVAPLLHAGPSLQEVIASPHRTPAFAERDGARNPLPVLRFFRVEPQHTVVELWPGGGWWSEILAPYLREDGRYIAAGFVPHPDPEHYRNRLRTQLADKFAADPGRYDRVQTIAFGPGAYTLAEPGSVDVVLTFRNLHSFLNEGIEAEVLKAAYTALKPGGVLGVVAHRGPEGMSAEASRKTGYLPESRAIALVEDAGFILAERAAINANPRDTHDHPYGVWSLPPSLRGGDTDREKFLAIGESDRMTLKFVKPSP